MVQGDFAKLNDMVCRIPCYLTMQIANINLRKWLVRIVDKHQSEPESERHWFLEIFLYPANLEGIICIGIIILLSFFLDLANKYIFPVAHAYGALLYSFFYLLLISYVLYYFGYCVFDSSKGNKTAPYMLPCYEPSQSTLLVQFLYMLGAVAVCLWPIGLYYGITQKNDLIFWFLAVVGIFFLPISLLRVALFDSLDALNPIEIAASILRVFWSYCGLILIICIFFSFSSE